MNSAAVLVGTQTENAEDVVALASFASAVPAYASAVLCAQCYVLSVHQQLQCASAVLCMRSVLCMSVVLCHSVMCSVLCAQCASAAPVCISSVVYALSVMYVSSAMSQCNVLSVMRSVCISTFSVHQQC